MVTLYAAKGTGSTAPEAVLAYAGADYQIVWIDYAAKEHHSPEFLAINPRGQLPALKLADDTMITESAAIMLHLGDAYPQANLVAAPGTSQRAQVYRWVTFLATNVYEDFLRLAYPSNYTTDAAGEASVAASGALAMDRSWGIVNEALQGRQHLVGDTLTIADVYMAMLLSWHRDKADLDSRHTNLLPAARKVLEQPAMRTVFEANDSLF